MASPDMNKNLRLIFPLLMMSLLVTQFNNCGNYASPAMNLDSTSTLACVSTTCVDPNVDNLKITPHLANGELSVPANLSEFNVGGDCNEGGFPNNTVRWELSLNGVVVRHSGMGVAAGQPANSRCVNGRFLLYVNLSPITEDPVDRSGLLSGGGVRSAYNLNVIILGQDAAGLVYQSLQNRAVVPLNAI